MLKCGKFEVNPLEQIPDARDELALCSSKRLEKQG